jgi:hypothetical protein
MTSSILTFLPETSAPAEALPLAVRADLPVAAVPDFAGLLAGVTPAEPAGLPPAAQAPMALPPWSPAASSPTMPSVPIHPGERAPAVADPIGRTLTNTESLPPPLTVAGTTSRMVQGSTAVARAGEPLEVLSEPMTAPPPEPTRAEQEDAMALLMALCPPLPAAAPTAKLGPENPSPDTAPAIPAGGATGEREEPPLVASGDEARTLPPAPGREETQGTEAPGHPPGPAAPASIGISAVEPRPRRAEWSPATPSGETRGIGPADRFHESFATHETDRTHGSDSPAALADSAAPKRAATTAAPIILEAVAVRADGVRLAVRGQPPAPAPAAVPAPGENSAGPLTAERPAPAAELRAAGKKLLSTSEQVLAEDAQVGGTTAANAGATMPVRLSPLPSFLVQDLTAGTPLPETSSGAPAQEMAEVAAPRVLGVVHEVVEAQEAAKLRPAPSVHLRLQVAGETIGLRVELRDEAVRTHFTTVSPELRAALTREWQAAQSEAPAGAPRLLDPVFPAVADRGQSSPAGHDAASQQQQQQARSWISFGESAALPSRRFRGSRVPEPAPAALPIADERLFSAVA